MQFQVSQHAQARMRQRGVRDLEIATLCQFADVEVAVGRGLHAMRLSRRAALEAQAEGVPAKMLQRLNRMVAVESVDGVVVTCARLHGRRAASYRRPGCRKFWRN